MRIFHIAMLADWQAAQASGSYTTSTRGRTLAEEGFIHASRGDQWQGVRDRFYADLDQPLVLLVIDPGLLDAPVVEEAVPDSTETFPHVYGAINPSAVVQVLPLDRPGPAPTPATASVTSAAPATPSTAVPPAVPTSFHRLFLAELGFRALLGFGVVLVAAIVGRLTQSAYGDTTALIASLVALVLAGSAGFVISRARDRRWREAHPGR